MIKTKKRSKKQHAVIEHEVAETLTVQCGLIGVIVNFTDAEIEGVFLTWLVKTTGSSQWKEFLLPGGETSLENLHTAIEEMLKAIKRIRDKKTKCPK